MTGKDRPAMALGSNQAIPLLEVVSLRQARLLAMRYPPNARFGMPEKDVDAARFRRRGADFTVGVKALGRQAFTGLKFCSSHLLAARSRLARFIQSLTTIGIPQNNGSDPGRRPGGERVITKVNSTPPGARAYLASGAKRFSSPRGTPSLQPSLLLVWPPLEGSPRR